MSLGALALQATRGPVYAWVGRRAPAYGLGQGGGLILSGAVPLDGVGLGLADPRPLPSVLARLGHVAFETVLAKGNDNGEIGRPWLLSGRFELSPSEAFAVGANRGMMFGGEGADRLSPWQFLQMLVGAHPRDGDGQTLKSNQVASVDVSWAPVLGGAPFLFFVEWGMEDNSGAWKRSPGIISGIDVAHPEGGFRLGLERSYLSGNNGHGVWYHHKRYRAGWSDAGRILGHPLGGPGTEWLLHGAMHGDGGRWDLELGLRTRHRLPENSFSPNLQGRSYGGFVNGWIRTGPVDLYLQVDGERTRSGTDRVVGEAGVRWSRGLRP